MTDAEAQVFEERRRKRLSNFHMARPSLLGSPTETSHAVSDKSSFAETSKKDASRPSMSSRTPTAVAGRRVSTFHHGGVKSTKARRTTMSRVSGIHPGVITPTQLSEEEMTQMYSSTIKLCQDNKINVRNTWNLNLIDYMPMLFRQQQQQQQEQVERAQAQNGENTDFQLAGVTLDASVKIYCSRVDSVHTNAFKVLGGLSQTGEGKSGASGDDDGDRGANDDDDDDVKKKRKNKTTMSGRNTLEGNIKNITTQKLETDLTIDPLFQKMSAAFDEGGASGMLINNLSVDPTGQVVFDSSEPASILISSASKQIDDSNDTEKSTTAADQIDSDAYDLGELLSDVSPPRGTEVLCSDFLRFFNTRMSNSLGDATSSSTKLDLSSGRHMDNQSQNDSQHPFESSSGITESMSTMSQMRGTESESMGFDYEPDDLGGDDGGGVGIFEPPSSSAALAPIGDAEGDDGAPGGAAEMVDEEQVNFLPSQNTTLNPRASLIGRRGSLDLVEAGVTLEGDESAYGFFSRSALSAWAGPQHWRMLPRRDNNGAQGGPNAQTKTKKKKKSKTSMLLDFSEEAPAIDFEKLFRPGKNDRAYQQATQASHRNGNDSAREAREKAVTLPRDLHVDVSSLTQLFVKPGVRVRDGSAENRVQGDGLGLGDLRKKRDEDGHGEGITEDDNDMDNGWHDFNGELPEVGDGLGDGWNVHPGGVEVDADGKGNGYGEADEEGLVDAPVRVEAVDINFARVAKKVDVRTLKHGIWTRLCREGSGGSATGSGEGASIASTTVGEGDEAGIDTGTPSKQSAGGAEVQRLQDVVKDMGEFVPASSLADVTLPYVFICLLHLANEKGLKMQGAEDGDPLRDVVISKDEDVKQQATV